jgi:hypothetical protein
MQICDKRVSIKKTSACAIDEWVSPKTLKEVQKCLSYKYGLRNFINCYADTERPIQKFEVGQKKPISLTYEADNPYLEL